MALAILTTTPAGAQSRVFVSGTGDDAHPCTFTHPCRTFQRAYNVVAANGEIDVIDPAGYGALTISKAISIQGHGFAGIQVPSGDGIKVNAGASDDITLNGLLIDGEGTGANGIVINTAGSVQILYCVIRHFGNTSISFPSTSTKLLVSDTIASDDVASGIFLGPPTVRAQVTAPSRSTGLPRTITGSACQRAPGLW